MQKYSLSIYSYPDEEDDSSGGTLDNPRYWRYVISLKKDSKEIAELGFRDFRLCERDIADRIKASVDFREAREAARNKELYLETSCLGSDFEGTALLEILKN